MPEAPKLKREAVDIPDVGSFIVTELVCGDALQVITDSESPHPPALRLLAACLVNDEGNRLYANIEAVRAQLPFRAYLKLHPIAQRLNGLLDDDTGKA